MKSVIGLLSFMTVLQLFGQAPSSVLPDIVNFKITYPLDENGNDYTGVSYEDRDDPHISSEEEENLLGYIAPPPYQEYFYVLGDEVVFKAHCAGALTSINAYPRCELREQPGGTNALWQFADEHELNATFRVIHLPDLKKEVCMLQIKGNESNSTSGTDEVLRLEYREDGSQGLHIVVNENNTITDIMSYSLGDVIEARLYVLAGQVTVNLVNITNNDTYEYQYASEYAWGYFKAGCYTQSSIWEEKNGVGDELPTAYGEVRFSRLILGPDTALPVKFLSFQGVYNAIQDEINLQWQVEEEFDNVGFTIERSIGQSIVFEEVSWVEKSVDNQSLGDYYFTDVDIQSDKTYYYRLKQLDADGSYTYSNIIEVETESSGNVVNIYPNPVAQYLHLNFNGNAYGTYAIYDAGARKQLSGFLAGESTVIDVSSLNSGVYYLQLGDDVLRKVIKR